MELNNSYTLAGMMVQEYDKKKVLITPKQNASITPIADLETVVELTDSINSNKSLQNATVLAVTNFTANRKYPACKKGNIMPMDKTRKTFGQCSSCPTTTKIENCFPHFGHPQPQYQWLHHCPDCLRRPPQPNSCTE